MTAQLLRIDDPRDALSKAKRYELYQFARANGLNEVTEDMPAILIRSKLRAAGKTDIKIPKRTLGKVEFPDQAVTSDQANAVDAEADLARQFEATQEPVKSFSEMSRAELAKECKARGIKFERTDKKEKLLERLGG